MATVTLTVKRNGEPAEGAKVILAEPFNKKFILGPTGTITGSLALDFATVLRYVIKMYDGEGKENMAAGGSVVIDVSEQTEYEIEV